MERKNPFILFVWKYLKHFRAPVINRSAFPVSANSVVKRVKILFLTAGVFVISIFGGIGAFAQCPDAPTGSASQTFCSALPHTVAELVAVGTAIKWYSVPAGGTPLASSTILGNGSHYYATQTVGGCESATRLDVAVTVNTTPLAPTGSSTQTFCSGTSPALSNLIVTGTAIKWYAAASGGLSLPVSTLLTDGTHYFASQTVSGCESINRFDVLVIVNPSPSAPTGSASQVFCSGTSPRVSALTATGASIKWYSAPSGGLALAPGTLLVNGNHYYATQTINGCESISRFDVAVTVNATPPAPAGNTSQTFCSGTSPVIADLIATGTAIQWYLFSSGGSPLATNTPLGSGTHYYASQTINGCESTTRLDVVATVNSTPVVPIGSALQSFCSETFPTVADLKATGVGIAWYSTATGGLPLATSTPLVDGSHYFASQTQSGCESTGRFEVTVTVATSPSSPTGSSTQFFCLVSSPTVADLTAVGTSVQWYSVPTGGLPLSDTDPLINGAHYYATQIVGCESISRFDVTVTLSPTPPAPTGTSAQSFCSDDLPAVSDMSATGTSIQWYSNPSGGSPLSPSALLGNGSHYYASQTVNGCEGTDRFDVVVSINTTPLAPTGPVSQTFCGNISPTISSLTASGTAVNWYSTASGGLALPSSTTLVNGTHYYASQTVAGCESKLRLDVTATVHPDNTIIRTSPAGTDSQNICTGSPISNIAYSTTGATGATITGLPSGVTGSWAANAITISGTPLVTGAFTYTITLTGGCGAITASGTITINPVNTVARTSAAGTDAQNVCVNTAIANITYATTGATGATFTGLPAGVTGSWLANVATISGTPSATGTFPYTVTLTGGCGIITTSGSITVNPNNTISRTSPAGTDAQTLCISNAITNITYATTRATGATVTGLPAGVTGTWLGNVVTISGTPSVAGTFAYTVTLTGGCGNITASGTITVNPSNTISRTSPAGTDAQNICINTPISAITYSTTGATGATITGLPAGVTGTWLANVVTISGTPTVSGPFTYTVTLTGGCGNVTATGTITSTANNTITRTSAPGSIAQTVCINNAISNITYSTSGATGATVTGLPAGVSGSWAANVVTISGTPTASGPFAYTVTLTGGCGSITSSGTITVTAANTITRTSAAGTIAQNVCINTPIANITYTTTGATGANVTGLPAGVTGTWLANVVTISGTPTVSGPFAYTVTLTGGCGLVTSAGSITVGATNTINRTSAPGVQAVCSGQTINNITYATTGATGATVTGLPAGVSGSWLANVVTISGTPTVTGPVFNYTVTLTGGCGAVSINDILIVKPNNSINLTSAAGTDAQTVCINSPITTITYSTTGATGATITGLPAGVTGSWAADVVTISGTPTVSGPFTYTITLSGGCGTFPTTGTIRVNPNNSISLTSPAGSNAQTICINSPLNSITYATTGAAGATFAGLPAGITGSWAANTITISGTPTVSGPFTYTVTLTGGCGLVTATGTITVTPGNTINRTSPAGTDAQTDCINSPITGITYATTGATGATVTGLPSGVTGSWLANVVTISGTPSVSGPFTYTITLTGGCGIVTATGTITVTPGNTISITSPAGSDAQTICVNSALSNITYSTTGATGATITGLPAGVTGTWLANTVTISGTPTASGPFTYTVTLTGGCGTVTATGTITVNPVNSISLTSGAGTGAQTVCNNNAIANITYSTTGATGATVTGLPAGVTGAWLANVVTISGTPTVSGPFTYTVTLTGGCGTVSTTGTMTVNPDNTISITSPAGTDSQTACINSPITAITYATTGATGVTVTGLPAGVTGTWLADVVTVNGTPTASGSFTYLVTLTGGCGTVATTGTITVNPDNTVSITSPAGTDVQTVCINSAVSNITYSTTGATGAAVTGLPSGVTSAWLADVVTISGTPTVAGTFTYTLTLTGGCGNVSITGTITISAAPLLNITDPASLCGTATADLTAAAVTAGSTPGLTFTYWSDAAASTAYATPSAATAGTYYIRGSDPVIGCFDIKPVTVTVNPIPSLVITDVSGACGALTGDLTDAAVTAGSTPGLTFTYWTDAAATLSYATPTTAAAGAYYIKGSDPVTGCFDIKPVTVTINPLPTVTITNPAALCGTATADLTASAVTAGSTSGLTYSYWTDAAATSALASPASATAGTYYIKGSDPVTGCFDIQAVTVTVNPEPLVTTSKTDIVCFGAATGTATAIPSGGSGVFTYSWNTVPVQTSLTANGLTAGTYIVTVLDANGCSATATVTITEPASGVSGSITSQTNVAIPGGNNGSVTVAGSGGTAPYQYRLGSGSYQASGTFGTLTAGSYTITVEDINLCTFDVPVTITEPSSVLSGSISSQTNAGCFGSATGSVTVVGSGGTPPYDFSIDGGSFVASGVFTALPAGNHIVTIRDAGLITFDVNFTITEPSSALAGAITSQTDLVCSGSNTGTVTVTGSGGTSPYQYRIGSGSFQSSGTFATLTTGSYTVTVQDANLCTSDIPVIITGPAPLTVNSVKTDAACFGNSNGEIVVTASGGTAPYSFSLNGGTAQISGTFSNLGASTYTIAVSDANLCTSTTSVTISEPAGITISAEKTDAECPDEASGSIMLTIEGGTAPYSAIWSDGVTTVDRQSIADGTYSVVVTDKNGCAASQSVAVGVTGSERCLVIPDIITPNNDGYNDTWLIKNIDLFPNAEISVFTRWGKEVYNSRNIAGNPWDGRFKGDLLPTDSYHYILHLNDGSKTRSGVISIIR